MLKANKFFLVLLFIGIITLGAFAQDYSLETDDNGNVQANNDFIAKGKIIMGESETPTWTFKVETIDGYNYLIIEAVNGTVSKAAIIIGDNGAVYTPQDITTSFNGDEFEVGYFINDLLERVEELEDKVN